MEELLKLPEENKSIEDIKIKKIPIDKSKKDIQLDRLESINCVYKTLSKKYKKRCLTELISTF